MGKSGSVKMNHDYGFIGKHKGEDGEGLERFHRPGRKRPKMSMSSTKQNDPATGSYDEDKIMAGLPIPGRAPKAAYLPRITTPRTFSAR